MAQNKFKGLGIALVTPFKADGSVDYDALVRLVDFQLSHGADFLCILGTTAETPTLTAEEKRQIRDVVVQRAGGRVPLLMGCGGNCTSAVINELKSTDWTGIDGVLSVCPMYNKPSQEGLYQHFKAIAQASPVPVVLYNVPGRTGVNMTAETTLRLARDCENVVAIKEASGNLQQVERIIEMAPDGFEVISGDDAIAIEVMLLGGSGLISATGNAFAEEMGELVHAALEGRYDAALDIHRSLGEIFRLAFVEGNPSGVKCMMHHRGLCNNVLRLPLVPVSTAIDHDISAAMKSLGTAMQE